LFDVMPVEGPTCLYFSAVELAEGAPLCGHGSCYAIVETSHDDSADCEAHGATYVTEYGSNSGFAGEGVYWWRLACGCSGMESGSYDGR
jgi:hypothetical protein